MSLMNKCLIFEDLAGMGKHELLHIREIQTRQMIGVSKYSHQEGRTVISNVNTHVSTIAASTTDNIKIDNKNRSFIIKLDESQKQTNSYK